MVQPSSDDKDILLQTFFNWASTPEGAAGTYSVKSPDGSSGKTFTDIGHMHNHLRYWTDRYGYVTAGNRNRCMPGDHTIKAWSYSSDCLPPPLMAAPLFDQLDKSSYYNSTACSKVTKNKNTTWGYTTHGVDSDTGCAADYAWSMYTRSTGNVLDSRSHYYYVYGKTSSESVSDLYRTRLPVQNDLSIPGISYEDKSFTPPVNPASGSTFSRFFAPKGAYGMVHHKGGHRLTDKALTSTIRGITHSDSSGNEVYDGTDKIIKKWKEKPNVKGLNDLYKNNDIPLVYIGTTASGLNEDTRVRGLVCAFYIPDFHKNPNLMKQYDDHLNLLHSRNSSFNISKYRQEFISSVAASVCFSTVVRGSENCNLPVTGAVTSCPTIMSKGTDASTLCRRYYSEQDDDSYMSNAVGAYCNESLTDINDNDVDTIKPYCYCQNPGFDKVLTEIINTSSGATTQEGQYTCWYKPCQITTASLITDSKREEFTNPCPKQCTQIINVMYNKNSNISFGDIKERMNCSFSGDNGGPGDDHNPSDPGGSSSINSLKQLWSNHSTEIMIILIIVVIVFVGLIVLGFVL